MTLLSARSKSKSKTFKFVASRGLAALGIAAAVLVVFVPKNTHADEDEVQDWDRAGELDENGMRFGSIVLGAELKRGADGWVLVRTAENTGDEAAKCTVEERLASVFTAEGTRVSPTPTTLILRTQTFALKAHEKKSIGVPVPKAMSAQMDAAAAIEASNDYERKAFEENPEKHPNAVLRMAQAHDVYSVDYLKPLPPGKRAAVNRSSDGGGMGLGML